MVLPDSSVWIRHIRDRKPYADELERLLDLRQVAAHDLVYGELLIGDRGGRSEFLSTYEYLPTAENIARNEVVAFVRDRGLHGRGAGWIDVHLLASALVSRFSLWTADERLNLLATELGIAYRIPK